MGANTFVAADIWTVAQTDQGNVVLIRPKDSDMVVPIFIGQLETQAILIGLGKVEMPRPLTHDLFLNTLFNLGAELSRIEITEIRDKTFYAKIIIKRSDGFELSIDSRPSDAIALAVRAMAQVYIAEDIVETLGVPVDMIRDSQTSFEQGSYLDNENRPPADNLPKKETSEEYKRLMAELEAAVGNENYELAAILRDKLKKLL